MHIKRSQSYRQPPRNSKNPKLFIICWSSSSSPVQKEKDVLSGLKRHRDWWAFCQTNWMGGYFSFKHCNDGLRTRWDLELSKSGPQRQSWQSIYVDITPLAWAGSSPFTCSAFSQSGKSPHWNNSWIFLNCKIVEEDGSDLDGGHQWGWSLLP